MKMISPITDSIFEKLNDEELLLINELYLEMKKYKNIIDELEKWLNDRSEFTNIGEVLNKLKKLKEENK